MTCVIAVKTIGGHCLLAADTCVSWKIDDAGQCGHQDNLQKIYGLTPDVAIAVTTENLEIARSLIKSSLTNVDSIVKRLKFKGRVWPVAHSIRRLFFYKWKSVVKANTGLLIGISHGGAGRIFWWQSSRLKSSTQELRNGEYKVLGSIREESELLIELEKELKFVAQARCGTAPIEAEQAAAILNDKLSQVFRSDAARKYKVGGLFQVALHNGTDFVLTSYDGFAFSSSPDGPQYDISLLYDHIKKEWLQVNHTTGSEVALISLDKHSFKYLRNKIFGY